MATITNEKKFMMVWTSQGTKTLRMLPGMSEISDEDLKIIMQHPVFKEYIERGWIKVIEDVTNTMEVKEVKKPGPKKIEQGFLELFPEFKNMSTREIVRAISEIQDKDKLDYLSLSESSRIADAAKNQLSVIG